MITREIEGLHNRTGKWIFLGRRKMSDKEVGELVSWVVGIYGETDPKKRIPAFVINSSIFKADDFAGLRITPPPKNRKEEDE